MFVRDPAMLKSSARRLNAMVVIANAWFVLFWVVALLIAAVNLLGADARSAFWPTLQLLIGATVFVALLAWPAWFAIRLGVIKCPYCGERFANPKFGFSLSRKCDNCGFDVHTVARQGDF
jgi:hypothetical protein